MEIKKLITLILLFIAISFTVFKYIDYSRKVDYLKDLYDHGGAGIVADIEYILRRHFEATGELPDEQSFRKSLLSISDVLFSKDNYFLEMNHSENYVLLYSYGPFKDNIGIENIIDAKLYQNNDGNYLQEYSFIKYLFNGGYTILFFNGKEQYDCNERSDYKTVFYTKDNNIVYKNKESEGRLDTILSQLDLKLGYSKNYNEASIFIYNNHEKSLNLMCTNNNLKIGKEKKAQLLSLLKQKFNDYKYVKFSIIQ